MINFPVFDRIDISGYGLFPGTGEEAGLHVKFQPGLTLVLGANGLGKTTLIMIAYRLMTGPFDIPGLESRVDLGYTRLTPTKLPASVRKMFGDRVVDNARNATARMSFRLGPHSVIIERRLSDLSLTRFEVNGQLLSIEEEGSFQPKICELVGVASYGDWILLLRYLIFYFEDRRALVWDPSAQRQLLRMLFLPPEIAKQWTDDERAILELDSRMRNLSAALYREERALSSNEMKAETSADARVKLRTLEDKQKNDTELHERLNNEYLDVENARQYARLRALKAEQDVESKYRSSERARLQAIEAYFPSKSETARYILAHLLTKGDCLVCGNHMPEAAAEYSARIDKEMCVVCGSNIADTVQHGRMDKTAADIVLTRLSSELDRSEYSLAEARRGLDSAEAAYQSHIAQMAELNARINDQSRLIDHLIRQLPPEEAEMHKQRAELVSLRGRVEQLKEQLESKRAVFGRFVDDVNRSVVNWKDAIKSTFDHYAQGFLLEQCQLVWAPHKEMVGQGGILVEFPSFELDMTGADFPSPVRRSGPQQVSESQREFIDLGFRMALMVASANGGNSSLVMDAPESSLDAVFASRAADVLSRFAAPEVGNRVVVTSNLVEGQLIPDLIRKATTTADRASRVIDLVKIATPTAAVRERREEYHAIIAKLLAVEDTGMQP